MVQLREMVRLTRRDGFVAVIDLISPNDSAPADRYNHYERLRDPSHTTAPDEEQLKGDMVEAGMTVLHRDKVDVAVVDVAVNVTAWLALTKTPFGCPGRSSPISTARLPAARPQLACFHRKIRTDNWFFGNAGCYW